MTNIILYGGSGTCLWPIIRTLISKQFVKMFESQPLFHLTAEYNQPIYDKQYIV